MAASIIPSRRQLLTKLRCAIFQTSYNPTGIRTGAKYLRARLRGPSMVKYYPPEFNMSTIARRYPELEVVDEYEQQRLQDVADKKRRGKGAPKKAKSASAFRTLLFLNFFTNSHFSRRQSAYSTRKEKVVTSTHGCRYIFHCDFLDLAYHWYLRLDDPPV
jgi:small subunit ribosomal protein S33